MPRKQYVRGRVPGGLRAQYDMQGDNECWGLQSLDAARRWGCNHDATRGTQDGAMCFACWVASIPKRGPIVEVHPRGASVCVVCGLRTVVGDDTCQWCQRAMDERIAKAMAELPPEPTLETRDRRDYVPRSTCVLTISGESGSVRMGRTGRVMR